MLSINFGLLSAVISVIVFIIGLTLVNFGYQAYYAGLLGASMIVGGLVGCFITGNIL